MKKMYLRGLPLQITTSVRSGERVIRFARTTSAHPPVRVTQDTHYRVMEKRAKLVQVRYMNFEWIKAC